MRRCHVAQGPARVVPIGCEDNCSRITSGEAKNSGSDMTGVLMSSETGNV